MKTLPNFITEAHAPFQCPASHSAHAIPLSGQIAEAEPSWIWDVEVPCCSTARNGFPSYAS